jgi:hypothetical protein
MSTGLGRIFCDDGQNGTVNLATESSRGDSVFGLKHYACRSRILLRIDEHDRRNRAITVRIRVGGDLQFPTKGYRPLVLLALLLRTFLAADHLRVRVSELNPSGVPEADQFSRSQILCRHAKSILGPISSIRIHESRPRQQLLANRRLNNLCRGLGRYFVVLTNLLGCGAIKLSDRYIAIFDLWEFCVRLSCIDSRGEGGGLDIIFRSAGTQSAVLAA